MAHFEVSVDGSRLLINNPATGTQKSLGFHVTLVLEAGDEKSAASEALSRVQSDPHITAVALEPPEVAVDAVVGLDDPSTGSSSLHGPIFCFFDAPAEG